MTGSTQGADAPLIRATEVMKTNTHMIVLDSPFVFCFQCVDKFPIIVYISFLI